MSADSWDSRIAGMDLTTERADGAGAEGAGTEMLGNAGLENPENPHSSPSERADEGPIAVSQQFASAGPWIVHGRNGNRQPKIAYFGTRDEAEICAENVRQVIAQAGAQRAGEVPDELTAEQCLRLLRGCLVDAEREVEEAEGKLCHYEWRIAEAERHHRIARQNADWAESKALRQLDEAQEAAADYQAAWEDAHERCACHGGGHCPQSKRLRAERDEAQAERDRSEDQARRNLHALCVTAKERDTLKRLAWVLQQRLRRYCGLSGLKAFLSADELALYREVFPNHGD